MSAGPVLMITADAWHFIGREAYRSLDGCETGGILLGLDDGRTVSILEAGGPGPNATRGPKRFLRDLDHAQLLAASAWAKDGSQWIGEWHTHPGGKPIPSEIDLCSYHRHLLDPDLHLDRFIAIIVALDRTGNVVAVAWLVNHEGARPLALQVSDSARPDHINPLRGMK